MNTYREFLRSLRNLVYNDIPYILIGDLNVNTNVCHYVYLMNNLKFEDGAYHILFGEIKNILTSFMTCYTASIDEVIREEDRCSHNPCKQDILELVDRTISNHQSEQINFGKNYLPVKNAEEKEAYDDIEKKYDAFIESVYLLRSTIERMGKQIQIDEFVSYHFKIAVNKTREILEYTHSFLALMLADRLCQIRVSLEEIHLRMNNNLKAVQNNCESTLNILLQQLYDKNKEGIYAFRKEKKCSLESAQISRDIEGIRQKIGSFEAEHRVNQLEEEVRYWDEKLKEFNVIAKNIDKMKAAHAAVVKDENIFNSFNSANYPGTRYCCWVSMSENFVKRKKYIDSKILEAAKCLITFFAVRGYDRIIYMDDIGPHYVDEYKHKVYIQDFGLGQYHINCDGDFIEPEENLYWYDNVGRHILRDDGKKLYQLSTCTSTYDINQYDVFEKVTKDCGHSEDLRKDCKMEIRNPNDREILPESVPIDIRGTLDAETANYLWDNFGFILSSALYDVELAKPKNPIHFLAHRLLYHKYNKTVTEMNQSKRDTLKYRYDIEFDRKQKAIQASLDWKTKIIKRGKPEDPDDAYDKALYDSHAMMYDLINVLNEYISYTT